MLLAANRYRLVYWDSVKDDDQPVAPCLAAGWIRPWLADPEHRDEVLQAWSWLGPLTRHSAGWMNERDLNTFVRPMIERALVSGELVLVERAPIAGWKPAIFEVPREDPTPTPTGPAKKTKTWIEFAVVDENGKASEGEHWEAKLPGGTVKKGETDAKGIVRFDDIDPGLVEFKLLDHDPDTWKSSSGTTPPVTERDFIEFELVDETEAGVPDQEWELKLADGEKQSGKTGADGSVRVDAVAKGEAELTFTKLDGGSWKKL